MTWTSPHPAPVDGPLTGDERPILVGYLGFQRTTLVNICAGLSAEQLASRPLPSTTLSLQGIVRHLAKVERIWLRQRVASEDLQALYGGPGDPTDFTQGRSQDAADELEQLQTEWRLGDDAVSAVSLDYEVEVHGNAMSLRMIYVHLIAEYARHNGHADLLREAIDGVTAR